MVKVKREKIEGITFEVTQLGFSDGRRLFMRLAKALGPGLAKVAAGAPSLKDLAFSGLIESALQNIGDADLEQIAELLGTVTRFSRDGVKWPFLDVANREALFTGEILLFFRWLWFALGVQFGDFSSALAAPSAPGPALDSQAPPSPPPTSNS